MEFSPLAERHWLLFAADASALAEDEQRRIATWLRQLACPVLGVGNAGLVGAVCDVLVESAEVAAPMLANIARCPLAAATLVQLLRAIETLSPLDALTAESLAYATLQGGPEFRAWLEKNRAAAPAAANDAGGAVEMRRDGAALHLELNRASNRNAMSVEMRDALVEALQLVLSDDSIERVTLTGRGKCFSVGGDLIEFGQLPDPASAHAIRALTVPGRYLIACAGRVEARVHGACIGSGIEFPAFAARLVARADAWFQLPELEFGLIPGAGGCASIARRIGRQRLSALALSAKRINAERALEWGLVDAVVENFSEIQEA